MEAQTLAELMDWEGEPLTLLIATLSSEGGGGPPPNTAQRATDMAVPHAGHSAHRLESV